MLHRYQKPVIIIRKKVEGENSIEVIANNIEKKLGVHVISVPYSSTSIKNLLKNIRFIRQISAPAYHIITESELYLLPFLHRGKRIATYHDLGQILKGRNKLYSVARRILQIEPSRFFADSITFVSEETKKEYLSLIPVKDLSKLVVIHNPYDDRLKPEYSVHKEKIFTILHVGTAERKNLKGMLEACKDLNVKFLIVGKVSEKLQKLLSSLQICYENYVDIPYEKIVELYNRCDIVSFPSFYEGFGVPVIEANVMGKPVICGNIPVLKEVGADAAVFVDPNDIIQIRNAVIELQQSETLRNQLISNGFKNAERFSPEKICKQYELVYTSDIAERKSADLF